MTRTLSPYEYNHLVRHDIDPTTIDEYGEMPVEYITGHVEFCGHDFTITSDTLIPRIETEELVDLAFEKCRELLTTNAGSLTIADVGTGSGAIAISLALKLLELPTLTNLEIYMSDVTSEAVAVAELNLKKLIPESAKLKMHAFVSDLLTEYPPDVKLDLVVSNLPYIPTDRIGSLDSSVKDFEPTIALDGGEEGLTLIQKMLRQVIPMLKPTSQILLEIDYTHQAEELIAQEPLLKATVITDQFLRQRFAIISLKQEWIS